MTYSTVYGQSTIKKNIGTECDIYSNSLRVNTLSKLRVETLNAISWFRIMGLIIINKQNDWRKSFNISQHLEKSVNIENRKKKNIPNSPSIQSHENNYICKLLKS